ncbi:MULTISPECIES: hypothetical protein [unclassified Streptomyces]|uniref:hypothetical protein n=1 Tax=unclassified Streptomyces TaxID=2593676 RepID=UPI00224F8175|nr:MULTISPECIES: hypothetical protein [unclassified Streptomyces]MCX4882205.1 hypothetical protein [Streptomyces sp. NBC_00847]MCX5422250.1 hypothetical protein [Streptomyces sp. NBC_00078]
MAHAAPTSGGMMGKVRLNRAARPTRTPDLFDERVHAAGRYGIPVVLGLLYGFWAAANRRGGGEVTGWNILFGFVTAAVFIVLCIAVATFAPLLKRELHSLVKSGFAGAAVGFLYSQTGESIYRSVALGVFVTAGVFGVFFYRYYTREDALGNRVR